MHHDSLPGTVPYDTTTCGRCGHALPLDGVPGLCPRCELSLALEGPADLEIDVPVRGDLGGYEMIEEAGRGGMGSVWKARQPGLGRLVAIKILPGGEWAGASVRLRFQREAEAAARLRHPHLVAVHDCGEHEGTLWYSMDFIEGESLAERIQRQPLAPREAAALMEKVTRAVAFAHSQGVWHRDLKPANILMDRAGEPHVTDFGLAHTEATTGLTVSGHLAGSPHYLPPERAASGQDAAPDAAGDVYALGATLYHVLTGRPPFSGPNVSAVLAKVISDEPARPSALAASIPRDLETICLKCLEKSPARRYATAEALADDLKRFLAGDPVLARPISPPARAWRWTKRHPALAGLGAALTLSVCGLFVLLAWSAQRSRDEAARLKTAADAAAKAEQAAQIESGLASARSARLSDKFSSRSEGLESLAKAAAIAAVTPRNETTLRALRDEAATLFALPLTDFDQRVMVPPISHDEFWWIERTRQWVMMKGPAPRGWVLAKADGSTVAEMPVPEPSFSTTCSRDGRYVFTKPDNELSTTGTLWHTGNGRGTALRKLKGRVIDWSPDSSRALRADSEGYAIDDLAAGREICRYPCKPSYLSGRFSNDGRRVAVTGWGGEEKGHGGASYCAIFDTASGTEHWQREIGLQVGAMAWSPNDSWLATIDGIGQIRVFVTEAASVSRIMQDPGGAPSEHSIWQQPCLEFTQDGFLASIGMRQTATLWDPASGRLLGTQVASGWRDGGLRGGYEVGPLRSRRMEPSWLRIHRGVWTPVAFPVQGEAPLSNLTWSPDGSLLAMSHAYGSRIWDSQKRQLNAPVRAPIAGDLCLNAEFLPDGASLLTVYPDGLWQQPVPGPNGQSLALPFQRQPVRRTFLARASRAPLMAAALEFPDESARVILFPPDKSTAMRSHPLPSLPTALALSPDGTRLAIGLSDPNRSLQLLDTADFHVVHEWLNLGGSPHALDFDPSGKVLAFAVFNAHLADCETGGAFGNYSSWSEADGIFGSPSVAFDPSGKWFAVTEPPRRIILHRRVPVSAAAPHGWQSCLTLESPSGAGLIRLSFSPDGRQLAAATTRPAFELWDLAALDEEISRLGLW